VSGFDPGDALGLLFDWDGTLADTQAQNYRALRDTLARVQIGLEEAWFDARTGLSSAEMIANILAGENISSPELIGELVAQRDAAFLLGAEQVRPHSDMAGVLATYGGARRCAVASGGGRTVINAVLERLPQISGFIEVLVTRDDVTRGKPAPDIFLLAAERLGLPPSACLVYEDSDAGMEAAAAAGMRAVDVRNHRAPSSSTS
jgi:HAD superfamily hydrolase (TIGR01509 family)